jgi:hypothetical protein
MSEVTTIQISRQVLNKLKHAKESKRQTYDELIDHAVSVFIAAMKNNSYDEFLHKIQQAKMKELWDNPEDEAWERA